MVDLRLHALDEATLSGDIFVAVRIGDVQKLGRIAPERQFKFVQPNIRNYRYGKMEIFQRIGSCNISADPNHDGDQAITVPTNSDRNFRFKVQLQNIEGHQHSKKSPRKKEKDPPSSENAKLLEPIPEEKMIQKPLSKTKIAGARYLEKHNFELRLAQAVQELMRAEPDDPASFMGEALKRSQGVVSRLAPKANEKDPVPASSSEENKTAPAMLTPLPTPVMPSDTKRPHVHEGKHHKQKKNKAPTILPPLETSKAKRALPEELPPSKVSSESPKEPPLQESREEPPQEPAAELTAEPTAEPPSILPEESPPEELSRAPFLAPLLSMPVEAWEMIYRSFAAVPSGAEVETVEERPSEAMVEAEVEEAAPALRTITPFSCLPSVSTWINPLPRRERLQPVESAAIEESQELSGEELQQELPQVPQQRAPMLSLPAYAFENIYNLFPAGPRTALADPQELPPAPKPQVPMLALPAEAFANIYKLFLAKERTAQQESQELPEAQPEAQPTTSEQANTLPMPTEASAPQQFSEAEVDNTLSGELPMSQPKTQQGYAADLLTMPTYAWEDIYRSFVVAAPEADLAFFEMPPQELPQAQPKAQQVLPDEAQDMPEASAEQSSTKELQVFKISFAFDNLDFDKVMGSPELADSLKNQVRGSLCDSLEVDPTCVEIELSKGSVLVDASISSLNPEQMENMKKRMESAGESLLRSVSECVSQLPAIADAAVDPSLGIGAGGLRTSVERSEPQEAEAAAAAEEAPVQPAAGAGVADAIDIETVPERSEDALFHAIDTDHNNVISREEFGAALEAGIIAKAPAVEKPAEEAPPAQMETAPPAPVTEKPAETEEVVSKSVAPVAERVIERIRPNETLWSVNPSIEANSQACTLDDFAAETDDVAAGTLVSTTSSHVNTDLAEQTVLRVGSAQANRLDVEATNFVTTESTLMESTLETPAISPSKPDADKLAMEATGETRAITPSRSEVDELTFLTNAFTPSKSEADELVLETAVLSPSPSEVDELALLTTVLEPDQPETKDPAWETRVSATVSAASSNVVSELGEVMARTISQAGINVQGVEEPVSEATESEAVQPALETQSKEVEPPLETKAAEEEMPVEETATPEVELPLETALPQVEASVAETKDTPPKLEESAEEVAPIEEKAAEEVATAEEKPVDETPPLLVAPKEQPADTEEVADKSVPALAEPLTEEMPEEGVQSSVAAKVSFKFENLDYDKVISSSTVTESLKHQTAETIADSVKVPLSSVDVQLSKGSVVVDANIYCPNADAALLITKQVDAANESLMQSLDKCMMQIPGLADALVDGAVGLGVGGLQTSVASLRQEAVTAAAEEAPVQPAAGAGVADAIDIETASAAVERQPPEANELELTTKSNASEPVYRLVFVHTELEEEGAQTARTLSSASTNELSDFLENTVHRYSQEVFTHIANGEESDWQKQQDEKAAQQEAKPADETTPETAPPEPAAEKPTEAEEAVEKSAPAFAGAPAEKTAEEAVPAEETSADETVPAETAPPPPAAEKPAETEVAIEKSAPAIIEPPAAEEVAPVEEEAAARSAPPPPPPAAAEAKLTEAEDEIAKIAPPLDEPPKMEVSSEEVAPVEEKAAEEPAPVEQKPSDEAALSSATEVSFKFENLDFDKVICDSALTESIKQQTMEAIADSIKVPPSSVDAQLSKGSVVVDSRIYCLNTDAADLIKRQIDETGDSLMQAIDNRVAQIPGIMDAVAEGKTGLGVGGLKTGVAPLHREAEMAAAEEPAAGVSVADAIDLETVPAPSEDVSRSSKALGSEQAASESIDSERQKASILASMWEQVYERFDTPAVTEQPETTEVTHAQPTSPEPGRPAIYAWLPSVGSWHTLHDRVPGAASDAVVDMHDAGFEKPAQTEDAVAKIAPPPEEPPRMEISVEEPAPVQESASSEGKAASEVFSEDSQKRRDSKPTQAVTVTLTLQRKPSLGTHSGVSLPSVDADALIRDALFDHPAAALPQVSPHHLLPSVGTWFLPLPLKEAPAVIHEVGIEESAPATTPPQETDLAALRTEAIEALRIASNDGTLEQVVSDTLAAELQSPASTHQADEADAAPHEVHVEQLEAEPARAVTPVNKLPSVGTWSMPLPRAQPLEAASSAEADVVVSEVAEPAPAEVEPAPATVPWDSKPSVGTWNMPLLQKPVQAADAVRLEVAEPAAEVYAQQVEAESSGEVEAIVPEVRTEKLEVEPPPAMMFFEKPSVGTWSMPLPKIRVQPDEAEADLSTEPAEQMPIEPVPTQPSQVSIFDAIDTDDNNMISREEFAAALQAGIIFEGPAADAAPPPPPPAAVEEHSAGSQDASAKVSPPLDEPPVMEVEEEVPITEAAPPPLPPPVVAEEKLAETEDVAKLVPPSMEPPRIEEAASTEEKPADEAPQPPAAAKEQPADTEEVVDKSAPVFAQPAEEAVPTKETPAEDVPLSAAAQVSFKFENLDYDKVISSSKVTESLKHLTAEAIADSVKVPLSSVDVQLSKGSVAVNGNIYCSSADAAELITKQVDATGESLMQTIDKNVAQIPGLADALADGAVGLGLGGLQTSVAVLHQEEAEPLHPPTPVSELPSVATWSKLRKHHSPPPQQLSDLGECPQRRPPSASRSRRPSSASRSGTRPQRRRRPQSAKSDLIEHEAPTVAEPETPQHAVVEEAEEEPYTEESTLEEAKSQKANQLVHHAISEAWNQVYRPYPAEFQDMSFEARDSRSASGAVTPLSQLPSICTWSMTACSDKSPAQSIEGELVAPPDIPMQEASSAPAAAIQVSFKFENLDFDKVMSDSKLAESVKSQTREAIAHSIQVPSTSVDVELAKGSVVVNAQIRCPTMESAELVNKSIDASSESLMQTVDNSVAKIPAITEAIADGKEGLGVGGLSTSVAPLVSEDAPALRTMTPFTKLPSVATWTKPLPRSDRQQPAEAAAIVRTQDDPVKALKLRARVSLQKASSRDLQDAIQAASS